MILSLPHLLYLACMFDISFCVLFFFFSPVRVLWHKGVREEVAATKVLFKCELKEADMKLKRENKKTHIFNICESIGVSFSLMKRT